MADDKQKQQQQQASFNLFKENAKTVNIKLDKTRSMTCCSVGITSGRNIIAYGDSDGNIFMKNVGTKEVFATPKVTKFFSGPVAALKFFKYKKATYVAAVGLGLAERAKAANANNNSSASNDANKQQQSNRAGTYLEILNFNSSTHEFHSVHQELLPVEEMDGEPTVVNLEISDNDEKIAVGYYVSAKNATSYGTVAIYQVDLDSLV